MCVVLSPVLHVTCVEDSEPKLKDLYRHDVMKYAANWMEIGLELELNSYTLSIIEKDHPQQSEDCFKKTLHQWLKSSHTATWNTLEIALTNVKRRQLGLSSVDNLYDGKSKLL